MTIEFWRDTIKNVWNNPKMWQNQGKNDAVFALRKCGRMLQERPVKLSDAADVKQVAAQPEIRYDALADWCQKQGACGKHAFVNSGIRRDVPLSERKRELMRQVREIQRVNFPRCHKS